MCAELFAKPGVFKNIFADQGASMPSMVYKRSGASRLVLPYIFAYLVMFGLYMTLERLGWFSNAVGGILGLFLLFATYLAYRLGPVRRFRRRLAVENFCMFCWYSLEGHDKEGACPECGNEIAESLCILEWYRTAKWYNFIFL